MPRCDALCPRLCDSSCSDFDAMAEIGRGGLISETVARMPLNGSSGEARREHVRRPVHLEANVQIGARTISAVAENISPGGAFLRVQIPPDQDELVASIILPHGKDVRVFAKVRWRRKNPPGVGVSFDRFLEG